MGKNLIIKGADFSANGISVVTINWIGYTDSEMNGTSTVSNTNKYCISATSIQSLGLVGKDIQYIKVYAKAAGTITFGGCDISGSTATQDNSYSASVSQGVNTIRLSTPIPLSASKSIWFAGKNVLSFYNQSSTSYAGWTFCQIGQTTEPSLAHVCIDVAYISES